MEQSTVRINEIMNDMAVMVEEQGENLDIISEELVKTHDNTVAVNKNLEEAAHLQKKSKKKYIIFALIVLVIIVIIAGIVFFLTQ